MLKFGKRRRGVLAFIGHGNKDKRQSVEYPLHDFHVKSLDDIQCVALSVLGHAEAIFSMNKPDLFGVGVIVDVAKKDVYQTAIKLQDLRKELYVLCSNNDCIQLVLCDRNIFGFMPSRTS